ncbi:hypothetical protein IWW42_003247 [Coemansia sp. RSA 1085]|nr:hypothetical protein IWW42_003247 [Coemansia sp. RSA 1085]
MVQGGDLPDNIIHLILIKRFSDSVLSIENWQRCLEVLTVCQRWRDIGVSLLYQNVIVQYYVTDDAFLVADSNITLALVNGYNEIPRALLLHTPRFSNFASKHNLIAHNLPDSIASWIFVPTVMRNFWSRYIFIPTALAGASIEPVLLRMPNLSHFFFSTEELIDDEGPVGGSFTNYNVGRQLAPSTPANATLEVDVVIESSHLQANLDTQELLMRRGDGGYVKILSAEYVNKLVRTHLAEYLLLDATEDELPDVIRNALPGQAPHGTPWGFVRNRCMFFFADIRFEGHFTAPTSYSLAVFVREIDQLVIDINSEEHHGNGRGDSFSSDTAFNEAADGGAFDEVAFDGTTSDDTAVGTPY